MSFNLQYFLIAILKKKGKKDKKKIKKRSNPECLSLLLYFLIALRAVTEGAFHLVKNSENSGSGLNGKCFFGSPDWKIPRKSGTAQKVVPFSRLERPNGNLCTIYRISRLYHQFHAFRGLLSGQASLGSLVFPKNGG